MLSFPIAWLGWPNSIVKIKKRLDLFELLGLFISRLLCAISFKLSEWLVGRISLNFKEL
jgi:hypothetical protein